MENSTPEPRCPANYFGKGVDYQLSDDRNEVAEYERMWREWEAAHPDDPTGEEALKQWQEKGGTSSPRATATDFMRVGVESKLGAPTTKIKLELTEADIKLLKRYASFKRTRPRDIVAQLIRQYCHL